MMEDTSQHKQLRAQLITTIRDKGINNEKVLAAISKVPRHLFVSSEFEAEEMYADEPLDIGVGQTISQPYTVAYQTQLLKINKNEKVLEIGTGSGYQAAVLSELGAEVFSIERQKFLYNETKARLKNLGYNSIHCYYGDGTKGLKQFAPFDKILITAAAENIPGFLLDQLKVGGIMVVPVNGNVQKMLRVTKLPDGQIQIEEFGHFKFVPLLPGVVIE